MSRERTRPFELAKDSDGCTLMSAPYLKMTGHTLPQRGCCDKHDEHYYYGGSHEQRLACDRELRDCVAKFGTTNVEKIAFRTIAQLMYYAVRVGGSPKLPFPWRWRYCVEFHLKDIKSGYLPDGEGIDLEAERRKDEIMFGVTAE